MLAPSDLSFSMSSSRLHSVLQRKSNEMALSSTTGQPTNKGSFLQGNTMPLALAERQHELLKQEERVVSESSVKLQAVQGSLSHITSEISGMLNSLALSNQLNSEGQLVGLSRQAEATFKTVVSHLNTNIAGKYHFSGLNTDTPPLPSGEAMLSEIKTLLVPPITVDAIVQTIGDWFESPTGVYYSSTYQGTTGEAIPLLPGEANSVEYNASAASPEIVHILSSLAIAAVGDAMTASFGVSETQQLFSRSHQSLQNSAPALIDLQSKIGLSEEVVSNRLSEIEENVQILGLKKSASTEVNQFEAISEYERASSQLELLYEIIGNRSRTSLQEFLR